MEVENAIMYAYLQEEFPGALWDKAVKKAQNIGISLASTFGQAEYLFLPKEA